MKPRHHLLLLLLLLGTTTCTNTYNVYSSKYPVSFSCDVSVPPFNSTATLGYFLSVRPTATKDGYKAKHPDGREHEYPYTEIQNRVFEFGLAGIIIGRPYFGEGEMHAYDLGCPQCDRSSARLTVGTDGLATCSKCSSSYDLNNGGIARSGDSRPLHRYRTTLNGNFLMIHN